MQFQVPQFIEVEDKIFGPFTFKQFLYLAGGAGLCYVIYRFLGFYLGLIPIVIVGGFASALAFLRINNRPFILIVESAVKYQLSKKLYLWRHNPTPLERGRDITSTTAPVEIPKLSNSKLKELSWSLDIKDRLK